MLMETFSIRRSDRAARQAVLNRVHGYTNLTLLSLLSVPAAVPTASERAVVGRLTHEISAELDCRDFPESSLILRCSTAQNSYRLIQTARC